MTGSNRLERLNPDSRFDPTNHGFTSIVVAPANVGSVYISGQLADERLPSNTARSLLLSLTD
jgi:hypothetical protein